jgi:phage shock protein C
MSKAPVHADNLLGICNAIGETFGFNPIYLRLALISGLLFSAQLTIGFYLLAGVAVATAHLFTRDRGVAARTPRDRVAA